MSTLEEQLAREIAKRGEKSRLVPHLRRSIAAKGQSLGSLYITGAIKEMPKKEPEKPPRK
jgi:hypothetical protein